MSESNEWDFGADAPKPDNIIAELTAAVKLLYRASNRVTKIEALLSEASKVKTQLQTVTVPEIMSRGGSSLEEITVEVEEGVSVTVVLEKNHVHAKLSEGSKDVVFSYMRDNGEDHLISNNVVVPFTKGQHEDLAKFLEFLKTYSGDITPGQRQEIHASTYTALCKRLVEARAPINHKDFGIHVQSRVKLVEPKTKRKTKKDF